MQEETARSAIDTFISAFNASDAGCVTALLSQALTTDVVFWGPLGRSEGIAAVEQFVPDIRRHPAGTGTMARCPAVDMPDEWARYQWVFTTPEGGPRRAGTDAVHLRRSLIRQIIGSAGEIEPSAPWASGHGGPHRADGLTGAGGAPPVRGVVAPRPGVLTAPWPASPAAGLR